MADPTIIEACIGAIWHRDQVLLLRRRPDDRSFPGSWCFPGGRVDPHPDGGSEPPDVTVLREIQEETGIEARILRAVGAIDSPWPARGRVYRVHGFILEASVGRVRLSEEHTDARWITAAGEAPTPLAGVATGWLLGHLFPGG
ncbi:MAG: NUDIX hydrolase [bacterium]